jgi:hypothetical protein
MLDETDRSVRIYTYDGASQRSRDRSDTADIDRSRIASLKGPLIGDGQLLSAPGNPIGAGSQTLRAANWRDRQDCLPIVRVELSARADGRLPRLLTSWSRFDVLVLDDRRCVHSPLSRRPTCSRSSRTGTSGALPSSPASCPSLTGTRSSASRPWQTPSSTGWFTAPTASSSRETPSRAGGTERRHDAPRPQRITVTLTRTIVTTKRRSNRELLAAPASPLRGSDAGGGPKPSERLEHFVGMRRLPGRRPPVRMSSNSHGVGSFRRLEAAKRG